MPTTDMSGKTAIVTGGNSGIGLETAVALSTAGARTLITARDATKGATAVEQIRSRSGNPDVELVVFDLADLASVREGAAEILKQCPRIDVLINNAGLMQSVRSETADGFETTFGVNHLGPFLLTELLLDRLKESAPARIVNVASTAHNSARSGLDFGDLQSTGPYRGMQVYGRSKLANIYFTTELADRLAGTGVTVNCLHPGTVTTGFARDGDSKGVMAFGIRLVAPLMLTAEKGARTSVYLASSPDVDGVTGKYFVKCKSRQPSRAAQDRDAARRLWEVSEELVGSRHAAA